MKSEKDGLNMSLESIIVFLIDIKIVKVDSINSLSKSLISHEFYSTLLNLLGYTAIVHIGKPKVEPRIA